MLTPTSAVELDATALKAKSVCVPRYFHASFFSLALGITQGERHTQNSSSVYCLSSETLPSLHRQHLMSETTTDSCQFSSKIPAALPDPIPEITDGENAIVLKEFILAIANGKGIRPVKFELVAVANESIADHTSSSDHVPVSCRVMYMMVNLQNWIASCLFLQENAYALSLEFAQHVSYM